MKSNSIVLELQELASNPNSNVEELLNKTLMVARKLEIEDLKQWCELELRGYDNYPDKEIPQYRQFYGQLKAIHPYYGIVPFNVPDKINELITKIDLPKSIGEIYNLVNSTTLENQYFEHLLPSQAKQFLIQHQNTAFPMEPKIIFHSSQLMNTLSAIRQIVLDWALRLEENGILGEGIQFSKKEKEKAMSNQFHIQNMQGIIGNISGGNVQQHIHDGIHITQGDFDALADFLSKQGIPYSDLQDLKEALDKDERPQQANQFGKNVSQWIGNIIGKIANGMINLSLATASGVLTNAISQYYGLNG